MAALAGFATLAFILAGSAVGIRLLRLAATRGTAPERSIGRGLFLIAGVAYPASIVMRLESAPDPVRSLAFGIAMAALAIGSTYLVAFARDVFRPEDPWARVVVWAMGAAWAVLFAVSVFVALTASPDEFFSAGPRFLARQALLLATFCWTSIEAASYWWKLRRRERVGLVEREVTNRMALWCIAGTSSLCSSAIATVVGLTGIDPLADPMASLVTGVAGLAASASLVLAFLPPKAYLAWVRGTT